MSNSEFVPQVIAVILLLAGIFLVARGAFGILIGAVWALAAPLLSPKEALGIWCVMALSLLLFFVVPGLIFIRLAGGYFGWFG